MHATPWPPFRARRQPIRGHAAESRHLVQRVRCSDVFELAGVFEVAASATDIVKMAA
jgi:hypothetical protein